MVKPHLVEKYNLDLMYRLQQMLTVRQTHKVTTYLDFNRCQQSAENLTRGLHSKKKKLSQKGCKGECQSIKQMLC